MPSICHESAVHTTDRPAPAAPRSGDTDDHLRFSHHVLQMPGGERRLVLVGRLLTEQERLQEQLFHRERLATLGLLTAGVAHDLGNPLAALSATVQRLEHEPLSESAREIVSGLRGDLSRLGRALRELVDFSRRRREDRYLASAGALVDLQAKLLRALEDHEVRPVGSDVSVPFQARVIAATNSAWPSICATATASAPLKSWASAPPRCTAS